MDVNDSIERIHHAWQTATSREGLDAAARAMIRHPSEQWKHYLDDLYLARRHGRAQDGLDAIRLEVLGEHEDALYGAVAEAIARANRTETK
jgi:hypothetical protein